jgi:hypothetical protein
MLALKTEREVRGFLGRLNYITQFIYKMTWLANRSFSFFERRIPKYGMKNSKGPLIKSKDICKIHLYWFPQNLADYWFCI